MANTFLKAEGIPVGASRVESDKVGLARELLDLAKQRGVKFLIPIDVVEADEILPGANMRNTSRLSPQHGITDGWQAVDIGAATIALYQEEIATGETILWNGPMGVFEIPEFGEGTIAIAEAMAQLGATTIIGGGDSVTAVKQAGLGAKMTFISTGGGATLELLEGKELPGVAALTDKLDMCHSERRIEESLNYQFWDADSRFTCSPENRIEMRKKIIAANWKMNMTQAESARFVESLLLRDVGEITDVEVVIIPPFTAIAKVTEALGNAQNIKVGAQNMYWEKNGPFTGEISAALLRDLFVHYVVLGHSERRTLFGETDEIVNRKVRAAHAAALRPIVCVGETLEQRDKGNVEKILAIQLRGSLAGLSPKEFRKQ